MTYSKHKKSRIKPSKRIKPPGQCEAIEAAGKFASAITNSQTQRSAPTNLISVTHLSKNLQKLRSDHTGNSL